MPDRNVLALVTDLIFATRIRAAAQDAGLTVAIARTLAEFRQHLTPAPALVIVDLAADGDDPLQAVRAAAAAGAPPVAYVAHVQAALAEQAAQAGAAQVLPRSAFAARLPELLRTAAAGSRAAGS